ncbi:helix-turn-helix domain-containing protein [Microbacterium sp. AZCO]|uniref:helix-turn-helix domain-containing protein n=1 Tax=Microbacterium sp. AZCO TaxID=3142976 RepID=UPI0031F3A973
MDELLTTAEAAEYLRQTPSALNQWRVARRGPRFVRIGKRVLYRQSDLTAFVDASVVVERAVVAEAS